MNPKVWGEPCWIFLFSIAFNYPDNPNVEMQKRTRKFLKSLKYVLPCETCQKNYARNIEQYKIKTAVRTKIDFLNWLINIYNSVRKENGKSPQPDKKIIKHFSSKYL